MNVIARLPFELAFFEATVKHFSHYTTVTPTHSIVIDLLDFLADTQLIGNRNVVDLLRNIK